MRRLWLVVLALLLLAPPVAASGAGGPVRADATFHDGPTLAGTLGVRATEGALDLSGAARAGAALAWSWTRAEGRFVESNWTTVSTPIQEYRDEDAPHVTDVGFRAARLRIEDCGPKCAVLAISSGHGIVGLGGASAGPMARRASQDEYCASFCDRSDDWSFHYRSPRGAFLVASGPSDGGALALGNATARVAGRVGLFVRDALVVVTREDGTSRSFDARASAMGRSDLGFERARSAFLYLDLEDAALDAPPGAVALLMATAPQMDLEGGLSSASASGSLEYAGRHEVLDHDPLLIEGVMGLAFDPAPVGLVEGLRPVSGARVVVEGTATSVVVGDRALAAKGPLASPAVATGGWAVALIAILVALHRVALVPFYSRMSGDRVLRHPNRGRILALLRERPGLTVAELRDASPLARIVVQHHLAMLMAHKFVRRTLVGRARRYYATDTPPDEAGMAARIALHDASRRRIAQAIADHGAATQRDLVDSTGLSQRLVSYHLDRLHRTSLVVTAQGVPKRYQPTPLLLDRLARND